MIIEHKGEIKSCFEHIYGKAAKYSKNMKTFGESGVVKLRTDTTPKILNKGATCMFVGYPNNHSSDC